MAALPAVHADNEWSPLRAIIVGRAGKSCFPSASKRMVEETMPSAHVHRFQTKSPFSEGLIAKAEVELDQFAAILESEGIKVYRPPKDIDWLAVDGYTGAMPRDGLISVGNTLVEACFAWKCRSREIELGFAPILDDLAQDPQVRIVRRPAHTFADTLDNNEGKWAINNSRPAFDTADFMRFGHTLIGQYSHVTNQAGVDYVRQHLPPGYQIEILDSNDPQAMHIDATILPLREGLLIYHPRKVTEDTLRQHAVLADWDLRAYPFIPEDRDEPPLYMTSSWLCLNALVLDGKRWLLRPGMSGRRGGLRSWGWSVFGVRSSMLIVLGVVSLCDG